jgi:lambda family phage portal protein
MLAVNKSIAILDARGNPMPSRATVPARRQPVRARYESAISTDENWKHWAFVDGSSARAANSKEVRYRLRTRARYEVANNSFAEGIVSTLANYTIGTGPQLQLLTPDAEEDVNRKIENAFLEWADLIDLAAKLRTMRQSLTVDGEAFGLLTTNPRLLGPVQLDMKLIEADQISTPQLDPLEVRAVDGIHYDEFGNPLIYDMLETHPGDLWHPILKATPIAARNMIHWFTAKRPGQCRGIPELTPCLNLFADLRRYRMAVMAAAETAADFAAVVQSEMAPDSGNGDGTDATEFEPFDSFEIERRMMTTLPSGWKMAQFKAEQPATTFEMFVHLILTEIARCLNMPFNIAFGNSSSYNYASGRLDHQTFFKSIGIWQSTAERDVLDRLFVAWIDEMWRTTDLIPGGPMRLGGWPHRWFWPGLEHIDPQKEANAQMIRLQQNTTTLADEYARRGQDWRTQIIQRAKELNLMRELGIPQLSSVPVVPPQPAPVDQPGIADVEDDTAPPEQDS